MASTYFNFSKTGGTGGYLAEEVVVTPVAANTTSGDNVCVVTVQGGGGSKTVRLIHRGIPAVRLTNGSTSVPATGATLSYEIDTHYPFCFKNVPAFVSISDSNGHTYNADTQYAETLAEGTTFYITIGANTGTSTRNDGGFYLGHYYPDANGTLSTTYTAPITFSQAAGASEGLSVNPVTIVFDWDEDTGSSRTITVTSNVSWGASLPSSSHYEIVGSATGSGNGTITIRPKDVNQTSSNRYEDTLTVTGGSMTATTTLMQYRQPRLIINSNYEVPPTGGTINMDFTSDYLWWFNPSLSNAYISMSSGGTPLTPPDYSSPSAPVVSGANYDFTYTLNNGNIRTDSYNITYTKNDGTTADAYRNFSIVRQSYVVVPSITVLPSTLVFDWWEDTGDTKSIQVNTNQASWDYSVSHNLGEFTVTKDGNYLRIAPTGQHTATNAGVAKRYMNLYFSADTATATATAEQYRKPSVNLAPGQDRDIPASGGTRELLVTSDYDWWLVTNFNTENLSAEKAGNPVTIFDSNSPYSPVSYESFDITWDNNNTTSPRPVNGNACFEVRYHNLSGDTRTDGSSDCGWRQSASTTPVADFISVSPTGASVSSGSNVTGRTSVTASTDWTLSTDVNWLRWYDKAFNGNLVTGSGAGETTIYRRIDANSGSSRTGTTTFTCGTASTTYVVQQAEGYVAPSWAASPTSFEEPSTTSPSLYVDITAATPWTIQKEGDFDADWVYILQPTGNQAAGESQLVFYITQNNTGAPRSANIKILSITEGYVTKLTIYIDQDYP